MGEGAGSETSKQWLAGRRKRGWSVALEWLLYGKILWNLKVTQSPFWAKSDESESKPW